LKVVACPNCKSKFKVDEAALKKDRVKMRCSFCSHVFTFQQKEDLSLEQEFESLLSGEDQKPLSEEFELEETGPKGALEEVQPEVKVGPLGVPGKEHEIEPEAQPESVIREIDSILGTGEEVGVYTPGEIALEKEKARPRYWIWGLVAFLLVSAGIGVWVYRDRLHFIGKPPEVSPALERGPFFKILENSITYEIVNNRTEGTTLVVKGITTKLVKRPLKSILIEARVYDKNKSLLETKIAYAGIIPDRDEFITNKKEDIDTLLTAEPASIGALSVSDEIPFAIAFFGKPALEGVSFQVEVKEYRWQ